MGAGFGRNRRFPVPPGRIPGHVSRPLPRTATCRPAIGRNPFSVLGIHLWHPPGTAHTPMVKIPETRVKSTERQTMDFIKKNRKIG